MSDSNSSHFIQVTLSVRSEDLEKIFEQIEFIEAPEYQGALTFWTEHTSIKSNPGKKYYYCPTTRETSWNFPEGNVEIIPYLIPDHDKYSDHYLRVYSPPSTIRRKILQKSSSRELEFNQNVQLHTSQ